MRPAWLTRARGSVQALTDYQAAYAAEAQRARAALARAPQVRSAELVAAAAHVIRVCANALFVYPVAFGALAGLAVSGWSLDAAMQGLHQVYFAQPAEQQQALLEGIVRAWAILAVMFVAFDMAVLDVLAPPRLSPLDRAVDLHMRQWEGRYIAALLQSTFREETHERPGEDR